VRSTTPIGEGKVNLAQVNPNSEFVPALARRDAGGGGVARELEHVATYNAAMLVSEDLLQLMEPGGGSRGGKPLTFSKL